ncbi:MAG: AGE family epimerase/isomerase [Verrucomicrobiaceae bacterium]|nr:AGE family epimerase/isomerase [Verrucomicrobiaceae bacterium]
MTDHATLYRDTLLNDVIPFWLKHGMDREQGGVMTCVDRDGSLIDTDKSVWFQGRAGWMLATLYNTVEQRSEWLEAAKSCVEFSRAHCLSPEGKMYFSVTREGAPLRMRRYVFSESFAAVSYAAYAKATGETRAADDAVQCFDTYLHHSFTPGVMPPKYENSRPMKGIAPLMIAIVTAQELRENLGDVRVRERTCTEWIDFSIAEIERFFLKPDLGALMEVVAPDGSIIDHQEGRTLNPGHAIECAWFIMHEGQHRGDRRLIDLGTRILDCMWQNGWDTEHGGLLYFTDVFGKPVQEYWHDMKFWWPHNEAIIATLLAAKLTGDSRYTEMHRLVHDWSFQHFPDPEHGEWYGYLHRDGRVSSRAKGTMYKGPFHLPRMLWYCWRLLGAG